MLKEEHIMCNNGKSRVCPFCKNFVKKQDDVSSRLDPARVHRSCKEKWAKIYRNERG